MALIKIELLSNLCVGSGYSYAGIVDSDVCYDKVGLPYIPARRIKGVLRDAAQIVLTQDQIDLLFGKSGDDATKGLRFSDAHIQNYSKIYEDLRNVQEGNVAEKLKVIDMTPQDVLEKYTTIISQTRIKDGVAEDNSLRYIRVINQYDPVSTEGQNLVFEASVDALKEEEKENLVRICKAVRHMGLNRNRGLGNVRFTVKDDVEDTIKTSKEISGQGLITVGYTLRNEQPLLLSSEDDSTTIPYIKGQMVQGALAGIYLRKNKVDEAFEKLFVSGNVLFSNAYPSEKASGKVFKPAPLCMGQYKETNLNDSYYATRINAQNPKPKEGSKEQSRIYPKPLRDKFISFSESANGLIVKKYTPSYEVVYHNRRKNDDVDRLLYMSQVISAGEYFSGTITGDADDVRLLIKMMSDNDIRLGKSKTAQYGKCRLLNDRVTVIEQAEQKLTASDKIVAVLESDAVFENEEGYTTNLEEVASIIQTKLEEKAGKPFLKLAYTSDVKDDDVNDDMNKPVIFANGKKQTGYYGVWNMRKTTKPAITAGSSFVFVVQEDVTIPKNLWVGVDNKEGYGQLKVEMADYYSTDNYNQEESLSSNKEPTESLVNPISQDTELIVRSIKVKQLAEQLHRKAIDNAGSFRSKDATTNSFVGRVKLMLLESEFDTKAGDETSVGEREKNFETRINSIRDNEKKDKALSWNKKFDEDCKALMQQLAINDLDSEEKHKLRFDYIMSILETIKYRSATRKEEK